MEKGVRLVLAALPLLAVVGCAKHDRRVDYDDADRAPREDAGVTEREPPPVTTQDQGPQLGARQIPRAITEFDSLVGGIDREVREPRHGDFVQAFNAMADAFAALEDLPPEAEAAIGAIRADARRIEASPASSMQHGDWARDALVQAADALDAIARYEPTYDRLASHARDVRESANEIKIGVGLDAQDDAVYDGLEDVAEGLMWAARQERREREGVGS